MEDDIRQRVGNTGDLGDTVPIKLTIPTALSCAPGRVGGTAHIHRNWSAFTTEPTVTKMPTPHWGPGVVRSVETRSAVTFHRRMGSFQGLSVKTGRVISGLGPHEQAVSEEMEVNPEIVEFDLQGLNVDWRDGPTYLTDFHALHDTDGLIAGEVKADPSYFLDPDYAAIMVNADRTLSAVGITFRQIDGTTLNSKPTRRRNVRRAYCDRFTKVSETQEAAVRDMLAADGEVPLGRIHAILANDPRTAQQLVHALLCRRVLSYDLDLPTDRDTPVRPVTASPAWVDIRNLDLSEAA